VIRPVIYTQSEYQKEFTNKYYYQNHFTYWKTWHEELMTYLGRNAKRESRSLNEIISNLTDMRDLLIEPKRSELDAYIEELKKIVESIKNGKRGFAERGSLDRIRRQIAGDFYYEKVKDSIMPDDILQSQDAPDKPAQASGSDASTNQTQAAMPSST